MNPQLNDTLFAAWQRVDDRLATIQRRHQTKKDIPLYRIDAALPATEDEIRQLRASLAVELPAELLRSLSRWNGRWIAHDHAISLSPIKDYLYLARVDVRYDESERNRTAFEVVRGPVNRKMGSRRRICFGGHEYSGSSLYIDFEDPPAGGRMGQIIRIGEEPIAEFVAPSFVDFLNLLADAPVHDDDLEFDPLRWQAAD